MKTDSSKIQLSKNCAEKLGKCLQFKAGGKTAGTLVADIELLLANYQVEKDRFDDPQTKASDQTKVFTALKDNLAPVLHELLNLGDGNREILNEQGMSGGDIAVFSKNGEKLLKIAERAEKALSKMNSRYGVTKTAQKRLIARLLELFATRRKIAAEYRNELKYELIVAVLAETHDGFPSKRALQNLIRGIEQNPISVIHFTRHEIESIPD